MAIGLPARLAVIEDLNDCFRKLSDPAVGVRIGIGVATPVYAELTMTGERGVMYLVVCAAPAATDVPTFVQLAQEAGWQVHVVATPLGMRFIDTEAVAELTEDRVRSEFRMPGEEPGLPPADAVVVAPATFNTINKWATGIADNFAVSLLCELTGFGVPILAVPLLKEALARHVMFERSLETLRSMGVRVLFDSQAPPQARMPPWSRVIEEVHTVTGT